MKLGQFNWTERNRIKSTIIWLDLEVQTAEVKVMYRYQDEPSGSLKNRKNLTVGFEALFR